MEVLEVVDENEVEDVDKEEMEETLARIKRGKKIKYIREKEFRISRKKFGEAIGVTGQFVGRVEAGRVNFNIKHIGKIVEFTGYTSDYLLFDYDKDPLIIAKNIIKRNIKETSEIEKENMIAKIREILIIIKRGR